MTVLKLNLKSWGHWQNRHQNVWREFSCKFEIYVNGTPRNWGHFLPGWNQRSGIPWKRYLMTSQNRKQFYETKEKGKDMLPQSFVTLMILWITSRESAQQKKFNVLRPTVRRKACNHKEGNPESILIKFTEQIIRWFHFKWWRYTTTMRMLFVGELDVQCTCLVFGLPVFLPWVFLFQPQVQFSPIF